MQHLPFLLLGLAVCAAWLPAVPAGRPFQPAPWFALFVAAAAVASVDGILLPPGWVALAILAGGAWCAVHARAAEGRDLGTLLACALALALAAHALPGFQGIVLFDDLRLGADSVLFTQRLHFDKGAAGLFLLAVFCPRVTSLDEARRLARPALLAILVGTPLVVVTAALVSGEIRFDPKLPGATPAFLAVNLLSTCVAEESFFRGILQERLSRLVAGRQGLQWLPVAVATLLFAASHVGGGLAHQWLVALVGLGCSLAYAVCRRIEAAILVHFAVNATHFLLFTYPRATG